MERIKLTSNLFLDEYIPKELYLKYEKQPNKLIWMIDKHLVESDQKLRNKFGPVIINNWWNGGDRNWSGIRLPSYSGYSQTSQHSWGRASDKIFTEASELEVQNFIQKAWSDLGITGLELGVSWVHTDTRYSKTLIAF